MKNSLRQVFRTPIKTGLFCVIFIFGTMLYGGAEPVAWGIGKNKGGG